MLALEKIAVFTLGLEQIFSSVASLEERWRTEEQGEVLAGNNFSESHTVAEVGGRKRMTKPTGSLLEMRTFGQ